MKEKSFILNGGIMQGLKLTEGRGQWSVRCIINIAPGEGLPGLWVLRAPGLLFLAGEAWILSS